MSVVETERLAEGELVFLWRYRRSLELGFRRRLAERIAATGIDLHELEQLITQGCPRGTAYRILRP